MLAEGKVGRRFLSNGAQSEVRMGLFGQTITADGAGRFYELANEGELYSGGSTVLALSANTITLTATTTPIIGVWNPATSDRNLVILQASLQMYANNLTSGAAPGSLVWAVSTGNTAISTGSAPLNRRTLITGSARAKFFTPSVALTGLSNNLVIQEAADFSTLTGLTYTTIASTAMIPSAGGVQNFDGSLIVPPGGVLALLNTTSSTTFSVASRLLWNEVPL
jgi:hypothetical protein